MTIAEVENEELTELSLDELEDQIATLASHIYAGTCRWLVLVAELDRRGAWAEWGWSSCAHWLAWRCPLRSQLMLSCHFPGAKAVGTPD